MKRWRVIFTGTNDAFFNMALDEALLLSCQRGASPPVLRLYQWSPPAVSIGYFQSIEETVDLKKCKDRGIDVVRRITGGRAVLHEDEITYSVCASSDYFDVLGENTNQTYQRISMALLEGLRVLGIEGQWVRPSAETRTVLSKRISSKPCFLSNSRYEITVGGKKLIGSAQRRFSFRSDGNRKDCFIQHGSILTGKGSYSLAELLPEESPARVIRRSLGEKSANIESVLNRRVEPDEIAFALKAGFEKVVACWTECSELSERELNEARRLQKEKYCTVKWNSKR